MAVLLALTSSLMWGTSDFLGGLTSRRLAPAVVVGWSQALGLAAVATAAVVTGAFGGPLGWLPWSALAGITGAAGLLAFYRALAIGTMGVVSPIAALGAIVPVLGALLAGETPNGVQVAGMVLGLAGAVAASGPELSAGRGSAGARSVGLAAVAGGLFGLAVFAIQRGARFEPLLTMVGMRSSSVTLFVLAALVLRRAGGIRPPDLPVLVTIGLVDVGANLSLGYATTFGLASVVAVLGALYPVVTVLLGAMVLGERMRPVQLSGVALALGGVAVLAAAG